MRNSGTRWLNASTIAFGTDLAGGPGTELDLNTDLGLQTHRYIAEYEGRCQLRPNWGIEFSFMPMQFRDNSTPQNSFFFGNAFYPAGDPLVTQWDRFIYRWDVIYSWFQAAHAVSNIFAGYALYDDNLRVSDDFQSRSRSRGFGLAYAGGSIERVIRNFCGGTASCNCRASVQFLEGYFGWDGSAAARLSVPMHGGRFGYVEAGWRWIVLRTPVSDGQGQDQSRRCHRNCGTGFLRRVLAGGPQRAASSGPPPDREEGVAADSGSRRIPAADFLLMVECPVNLG